MLSKSASGNTLFFFFFFVSLFLPFIVTPAYCSENYDIAYSWFTNLDDTIDYKEEMEPLLGPKVAKSLKIVGRGEKYGIVYNRKGSALLAAKVAIAHSEILRKAGLQQAKTVAEKDYFDLYNVCYGLGRNLDGLERQYGVIYRYLGSEVGKNLYIEKTDSNNYLLIYRRRGNKQSTYRVAARHAAILKKKKIPASITRENNNTIIRGESSYLDKKEVPANHTHLKNREKQTQEVTCFKPENKKIAKGKVQKKSDETSLEKAIEAYIGNLRRKGKIHHDEQTAWLVYDFTRDVSLVDINVDHSLQAASMIKPFVALAFFKKVKEGKLVYGPKSRRKMEAMIQQSDNDATNWIMRYVGGPRAVQQILKNSYGSLFKHINIVEYIPSNGRTYKNQAAPYDYGMFLRTLWNRELTYGKEIRRLMALPGRDRLYNGTPIPQGTLVYNKTGTTAHLCGDMGIISPKGKDGRRYPYTIVGIIEKKKRPKNYSHWKLVRSNVIRKVSSMVYTSLKAEYNLR